MTEYLEYFDFLDELRESGVTNMFGAVTYLRQEFPELRNDPKKAAEILRTWMDTYADRGCP